MKNLHACFISLLGFYLAYIIILFYIFALCTYFLLLFCTLKRWNEPFKFSQLDQSGPKFTQSRKWRRWRTHWPQLGLYGNRQAFGCTSTNSFTKRFLCLHWRQWRWFRCFFLSFYFNFFCCFCFVGTFGYLFVVLFLFANFFFLLEDPMR